MSVSSLLSSRRLLPLTLSQACSAINDNLVKNALIVLAIFKTGSGGTELAAMAGALFILPYIFLSATSGVLADKFNKRTMVIFAKVFEVILMVGASYGFYMSDNNVLLGVLFGLGLQATILGPLKYGILPSHLSDSELVTGNGIMEASTFLAILAGTVGGGALVLMTNGLEVVSSVGIVVSLLGLVAGFFIPSTPSVDPTLKVRFNILAETWNVVKSAKSIRPVWLSILGLTWFWTVGATLLTEFPSLAKDALGADGHVVTLLLTMFAIGIGFGSILCARLLKNEVSPRHVPFAALGISLFAWDLAHASMGVHLPTVTAVMTNLQGWRIMADLLLLSVCGGIYSVPLYAIMQENSPKEARSRMIAANNIINALLMAVSAGIAGGLAYAGVSSPTVILGLAGLNLLATIWIVRIIPKDVMRSLFRWYFETFHGVDVKGLENYREAGDRVVIVSNHLSFADASLIACFLPDSPTFAVHTGTASLWWAKPFLAVVDIFKVDVQSPYSIKRMVEAVRDDGRKLMIFPEGRLTKTGSLMKVYEGAGVVADKAGAKVLPIAIEGLQFTRLGRMGGKLRMQWFPRLKVTIMPAVTLTPANSDSLSPRQRRQAIGTALQDLLVNTVFMAKNVEKTIFSAFLDARNIHGGKTLISEDALRQPLSYNRLLLGGIILGEKISSQVPLLETYKTSLSETHKVIGVMLPNSNATLVTFLGLQAWGRVPAMLNFSSGATAMLNCMKAVEATTIVSSKAFVEKGKLDKVVEEMSKTVKFIWLEDLKAQISFMDKIKGKLRAFLPENLPGAGRQGSGLSVNNPAVILFTSGSEGMPKGVVLSHRNILTNCNQLSSVVDFTSADRVFNAMPVFHSFGLTGGTILPLLFGVRTFHYPSPLHYKIVPTLIYDTDATIVFGTDTFLNGWARFAHPYDFYAVRYVFSGAERVKDETRRLFADRFGVRLLEGYGATETSPALSMNTAMHCRPGTVGRLLPGIETKLEAIEGVVGKRLFVKGENVMLGYLKADKPGVLEPCPLGWYDTGDVVTIDQDGFIKIEGRAKRFAKIAGEMVSMAAAENLVSAYWKETLHAVVAVPDARKGEKLVLVTTQQDATTKVVLAIAREKSVPEIMVPREVIVVSDMPLLGTGKANYPAIQMLVIEKLKVTITVDENEEEENV